MPKQTTKTGTEATSTSPPAQRWPKIVPAPAVWESGSVASRQGRMSRSFYRPRRLAVDPAQRSTLW